MSRLRALASHPFGHGALPVVLGLLAVLPFVPALDGEFLRWDDDVNLVANEAFRGLGWSNIKWMFTTTLLAVYTPLAWLTLAVNHALGGMDPWGYHLGNLLLHGASVAVLHLVARRLLVAAFRTGDTGGQSASGERLGRHEVRDPALELGALVAALAWGVHPLRVESVAWVTERRDVLCGLFYLLAVLAYLRGTAAGGLLRGRWLAASLVAFAAALLSKGIVMTLPLTLLLLDAYPLRRLGLGGRALAREKIPFLVLAGLGAAAALFAVGQATTWTVYESHGLGARVAMVGYSVWFYPWTMVWPAGLSPLYELPPVVDPLAPRFLVPLAATVVTTVALILVRRRCPGALAAWAHSAIVVAPVSGVVHAGNQLAHDRFSYLSGLGFAVLVGAGMIWIMRARRRGRIGKPVAALVVIAMALTLAGWSAGTWRQCKLWHDSETLWRAAVDADGRCAICRNNLGAALMEAHGFGDPRRLEAEAELREAIALRPNYVAPIQNLGRFFVEQGDLAQAVPLLRSALARDPASAPARLWLAQAYRLSGRDADAEAELAVLRSRYPAEPPEARDRR